MTQGIDDEPPRYLYGGFPELGHTEVSTVPALEGILAAQAGQVEAVRLDGPTLLSGGLSGAALQALLASVAASLRPGGTLTMTRMDARFGIERLLRPLQQLGLGGAMVQRPMLSEATVTVYQDDGERPSHAVRSHGLTVLATIGRRVPEALAFVRAYQRGSTIPYGTLLVVLDEGTVAQADALCDAGCEVLASPHRRGLVAAYNDGFARFLQHPQYTWLHLVEDGLTPTLGYDAALWHALVAHPGFGWVACGQVEHPTAPFTALCSMFTRECVEAVWGFDPLFAPCQFDDGDLYMRCRVAGFFPTAVHHLVHHPEGRTSVDGPRADDIALMRAHQQRFAARWGMPDMYWHQVAVHWQDTCPRCTPRAMPDRPVLVAANGARPG
jgi:hypothetical protein